LCFAKSRLNAKKWLCISTAGFIVRILTFQYNCLRNAGNQTRASRTPNGLPAGEADNGGPMPGTSSKSTQKTCKVTKKRIKLLEEMISRTLDTGTDDAILNYGTAFQQAVYSGFLRWLPC
jgi:hypothetical protein